MVKKTEKKKRARVGEMIIKRKYLDNKSRKGWYYYIREVGKKPSYYKISAGVDIDNYLMAYKGKIKSRKRGVIQYKDMSEARKYLMKVDKSKKIDDLITKGITETKIENIRFANKRTIVNTYKKMLDPLIADKDLLKVISMEENVRKFKHRIQGRLTISSSDGDVEIYIKSYGKDVPEIMNDLKNIKKKNFIMEEDIEKLEKMGYKMDGLPKGVDVVGSKYHILARKLGKIKLEIKFVKGK